MQRMRNKGSLWLLGLLTVALGAITASAGAGDDKAREYVVVYEQGVSASEARQAVEAAGGSIVSENAAIGVATVQSDEADFAANAAAQDALEGAAANQAIGKAPRVERAFGVLLALGDRRRSACPADAIVQIA